MKQITYWLLCLINLHAHAQTKTTITIGNLDSVYSNILHEQRKVWVSMPDTTSPDGIFYPQHYPVVYMLDGDEASFATVGVMLRQMGGGIGNTGFPQVILIGIPNTDRNRDLTPTRDMHAPMLDSFSASHTGGGENFISFMEKELIPYIDSSYPTAPYRVIIGHSFGGLTAMHILINHTRLFNAYLASDPSMFWSNQQLLKQSKQVLQQDKFTGRSLFLAMANTMPAGMDTQMAKLDTNFITLHIRSIMQLGHYLNNNKNNGLRYVWKYYKDYDHGGVTLPSEYDGLPSLFTFYGFNMPYGEFFNPSYKKDTIIGEHYKRLSKQMGYTVSPPEQFVSVVCHQLTDMKQFDRAFYFLQMNLNNYPKSAHAYADMGRYYTIKGDEQMAVTYYEQSLTLRDDPEIRNKLNELKQAK